MRKKSGDWAEMVHVGKKVLFRGEKGGFGGYWLTGIDRPSHKTPVQILSSTRTLKALLAAHLHIMETYLLVMDEAFTQITPHAVFVLIDGGLIVYLSNLVWGPGTWLVLFWPSEGCETTKVMVTVWTDTARGRLICIRWNKARLKMGRPFQGFFVILSFLFSFEVNFSHSVYRQPNFCFLYKADQHQPIDLVF